MDTIVGMHGISEDLIRWFFSVALSSPVSLRFKNELERNITIKLGYANAKIYKSGKGFLTDAFTLMYSFKQCGRVRNVLIRIRVPFFILIRVLDFIPDPN